MTDMEPERTEVLRSRSRILELKGLKRKPITYRELLGRRQRAAARVDPNDPNEIRNRNENVAQSALQHYNNKHGSGLEFVRFLDGMSMRGRERHYYWRHLNFEARRPNAGPKDEPLLLFAEVYSGGKGLELTTLSLVGPTDGGFGNDGSGHLKDIAALIETGAYTREVRRIIRAIRWTIQMRTKLNASVLSEFFNFALVTGSETHSRLSSEMSMIWRWIILLIRKHALPELEIYCYLLVLIFLIDQKRYNENLNRITIDVLASRLYSYYSLSYELTGNLAEIRGTLLSLHRTATLRHDELGQETLLNLLLRNYLHYNLYDQAEKLRSKAPRFEGHSNQQARRPPAHLVADGGEADDHSPAPLCELRSSQAK
ncbi:26S proteasome non-ATPase regulatory subunit 3 homolog A, partial [Striga asiatica]